MSYLQSSDIRQLFPRKLALQMRERKKKKKKQVGKRKFRGRLRALEKGPKSSERVTPRDLGWPKIKVTWPLPSLERFSFL